MKYSLCILLLALASSCDNDRVHQSYSGEISSRTESFNGYTVNNKRSGEAIQYEGGKVKQRDYYVEDSLTLSIYYSKEKPVYAQVFEHNDVDRQIVFDVQEFNNKMLGLQENNISDEMKGKRMFQYYCASCHLSRSGVNPFERIKDSTMPLYDLIKGATHPISFEKMDSIELHYLGSYIQSL